MITIAKGSEKLKVSEESFKTFFEGIGYQKVEDKKAQKNAEKSSEKNDTKINVNKKDDEKPETLDSVDESKVSSKKGDK